MKILLRNYQGEPYVWKDAKYNNDTFWVDNTKVSLKNIVSIYKDNRKNYIKCNVCGETFKKGSPKIAQHKIMTSDISKCHNCVYMLFNNGDKTTKIAKKSEGTYSITQKFKAKVTCRRSYEDIDSPKSKELCWYNQCVNMKEVPIDEDIFMSKPGLFDDIITTDTIVQKGYKTREAYGSRTYYTLKGRYTIKARVNSLNIVECFNVQYRNNYWDVYYSKKYNEFYVVYNNTYIPWATNWMMSNKTVSAIKKKIASLYE